MLKFVIALFAVFFSAQSFAFTVDYICESSRLSLNPVDPVIVLIEADTSDRRNKKYVVTINDEYSESFEGAVSGFYQFTGEIPSLNRKGSVAISVEDRVLAGAVSGRLRYKKEGDFLPHYLKCSPYVD